jgi:hypothetical protein
MNLHFSALSLVLAASFLARAQSAQPQSLNDSPAPELARLASAFVGDWDTSETMEKSEYFPNGGGRHGTSRWRLGVGGTTVIDEGHSNGSVGPLDHLVLIWWDKKADVYQYLVCFKDVGSACWIRGTAHWDRNDFINDYGELSTERKSDGAIRSLTSRQIPTR